MVAVFASRVMLRIGDDAHAAYSFGW